MVPRVGRTVNLWQYAPMRPKPERLVLASLLQKLAPRAGARVVLEPEWKIAGQIRYRRGPVRYFRYNTLDLNPVGASDIARDKDYAAFFMRRAGFPVPEGRTFFSEEWRHSLRSPRGIDAAYRYAKALGFPVIVKPNSGTQGIGVALVHTKKEFYRAMRAVFGGDRVALVQRPYAGRDYRIVILDGDVISAYERIPLSVIGDGRSTIRRLIARKQREFARTGRDTRIKPEDPRIRAKLAHAGLSLDSAPARGARVFLLDNANLSSGGDAIDVTGNIHPAWKKLAADLTREMGLRLCGVDVLTEKPLDQKPRRFVVLEINAAPGLDHYVKTGPAQRKIVEKLYLRVLKRLGEK